MIEEIKDIIYGEGPTGGGWLPGFLRAAAFGYAKSVGFRTAAYRRGFLPTRQLSCKVISIGNLTLGGTGKTPFTMTMAQMLAKWGIQSAVISRGYRGRFEKPGAIVSDGRRILVGPAEAGDEPYLLAQHLLGSAVPVLIGADRFRAGNLAVERFNPDVILLDDGFQHIRLARDVDLVLLDSLKPFGNSFMFPRGSLREPVSALKRADAVVFTRCGQLNFEDRRMRIVSLSESIGDIPVFFARHVPFVANMSGGPSGEAMQQNGAEYAPLEVLAGRKVFAFSGIARNEAFKQSLEAAGCRLVGFRSFPDHHPYLPNELTSLAEAAGQAGGDLLATTEKDYVRFYRSAPSGIELAIIGVRVAFEENGHRLSEFIRNRLQLTADTA